MASFDHFHRVSGASPLKISVPARAVPILTGQNRQADISAPFLRMNSRLVNASIV